MSGIKKEQIQKALDEILNSDSVLSVKDEIEKAENLNGKKIEFDIKEKKISLIDLSEDIDKNDVIMYEENGNLQKAVVTAIGKDGVTGRNVNKERVRLYYGQILKYEKRN